MAAKHFLENYDHHDPDQHNQKRMKKLPSFASVIKEAVTLNVLQNFCSALEPMLRRVVKEEVQDGISRRLPTITRSPSLRIQAPEPSSLQLIFAKRPYLPIFTGSKIVDVDRNPLQLFLVDAKGDGKVPITLPHAIKIEIVVLDGDFADGDHAEKWTDEEFNRHFVKERAGKRPLLTGDVNVTMRDGYACVGELEFTDNSSWIRSRKFRIGARVVQGTSHGIKIRGAVTAAFVVKDHRGELYKKHYPPALGDEVWRLEKIGKDGVFHRKLSDAGIKDVQDFLKLSNVDRSKLRRILGHGMSDRIWDVTMKHARSCVLGNKFYTLRGNNYSLTLDPTCQVVKAVINGQTYPTRDFSGMQRTFIENLVRTAYANWNSLEEVEGLMNETPLLTQGGEIVDEFQNQEQTMVRSFQQQALVTNECDWDINAAYIYSPVESGVHDFP